MNETGKLEVGQLYVVFGRGPVMLEHIPEPTGAKQTCRFLTLGKQRLWADASTIVKRADSRFLKEQLRQLRATGLDGYADRLEQWLMAAKIGLVS